MFFLVVLFREKHRHSASPFPSYLALTEARRGESGSRRRFILSTLNIATSFSRVRLARVLHPHTSIFFQQRVGGFVRGTF
jgi:hypothetical protein